MLIRLAAIVFFTVMPMLGQTTAIHAGHVIDPATGLVADDQVILVTDGKIAAVGRDLAIPKDSEVIDLPAAWILPGLMDAHTHLALGLTLEEARGGLDSVYLREGSGLRALRGMRSARQVLEAGFTAVRDVGSSANYIDADVRIAIEHGWFPGPAMINSGKIIAPYGGESIGAPPEAGPYWRFEYIDADSPDAVRQAVRRNIFYGAQVIKLLSDGPYVYSEEEIRAAVEEAHRVGRAVAVHVQGGQAARNVILAGADSVEHGFELSNELLSLMKEKGTFLVGTDIPLSHLAAIGLMGNIFPVEPHTFYRQILDRLRRAHQIGVKMAFGSDVFIDFPGKSRGQAMLDYLDVSVEAGIAPAEILKMMTTNAAELLRVANDRGAIAAGKYADIVATPENPLENIQALRKINFVMKEGKIIKRPQ